MFRLKQLKVKGVRGIVDGPDVNFLDGGLLLCGDNGTGKSSYVDALEKVLAGRCSSLEHGGQSVSWRKQGQHIDCDDSEISLVVTDGTKDVCITLDTEISALDKRTQKFIEAARLQSFVLRRRTLLDFIDAIPSDRYKAIGDFLRLDEFVAFETKLKDLHKDVKGAIKAAKESIELQESTLRGKLGVERSFVINDSVCLNFANQLLDEAKVLHLENLGDLSERISDIDKLLIPFSNIEIFQKAQSLVEFIDRIPQDAILCQSTEKFISARKAVKDEEHEQSGHFYAQVLEKGLSWIKEDDLTNCPVCNNSISMDEVTAFVESRLANNQLIIQLKQHQSNAQTSFLGSLQKFRSTLLEVKKKWEDVTNKEFPKKADDALDLVTRLYETHQSLLSVSKIESDVAELSNIGFDEIVNSIRKTVELKLDSFPDNSRYNQLNNLKSKLLAISVHMNEIRNLSVQEKRLGVSESHLEILSSIVEKGRKNAIQKLLNSVVEIADKYFQKIHPGEKIGKPELIIPDRGSGSINLTSTFHSKSGDPRGHYSEGHVDSLGLCLFLAIRRLNFYQRPELSILVLDDIMHSVDANHRWDTANLIFSEFADHQILITTHDPLWFEYLKIASRNSKNKFTQKRIASWSLETGPIWGDHLSNFEWLISSDGKKAKPSDKVNKAGLLLEELLQNICSNLMISVPFRIRGDYTIDPLWSSFYSKAKRNQGFYSMTQKCLEDIDALRNLRNWTGAHWNEWAQTLTDVEANTFVQSIIDLRNYVYCDTCNQFISRISELDGVWSCKRECKRYNNRP